MLIQGCSIPKPVESQVSAPTNLAATAGDGSVTLAWTASTGAISYTVRRSIASAGPYARLVSVAAAGYVDATVTNGTTYYYVVSALDADGESTNTAPASATPSLPRDPPVVPANVAATASSAQVGLTWTASVGASSYRVKRSSTDGGPYSQIATTSSASYSDSSVTNDTSYFYVISAVNSAGESANSAQVRALPVVSNPPPTAFGTWTNVTPAGIDLVSTLCSNFGTRTVQVDRARPGTLYAHFDCQGIWRSSDYGLTWSGPINTGTNGALVSDCSGGITVVSRGTASPPTLYEACIRGGAEGFWKSVDGGVNWTRFIVAPGGFRQDYYPPAVDPYDENHLLTTGHEFNSTVESFDGGQTWNSITVPNGMLLGGGSAYLFFIDTGVGATTRGTWLWISEQAGGAYGTWRTADSGATWTRVDSNETPLAAAQIYQPDTRGTVFMAGANSASGRGVLRSTDYGRTWFRFGPDQNLSVVFGTARNVYAMFGFAAGPGGSAPPAFQVATQPGTGTWATPPTPAGLTQGPAQVAVVNDGTRNIFVGAMFNSGLWRYVEP